MPMCWFRCISNIKIILYSSKSIYIINYFPVLFLTSICYLKKNDRESRMACVWGFGIITAMIYFWLYLLKNLQTKANNI